MATAAESLAYEVSDLRRRLAALERAPQLSRSTIQDADGNPVPLADGVRAGMSAGEQAARAIDAAASALAKADGAVESFFGDKEPEGGKLGDFWRKSSGEILQHDGATWAPVSDPEVRADLDAALDRLSETEGALDGKISTYIAPLLEPPAAASVGDLWIVTPGNFLRRWSGQEWVDARDAGIEEAQEAARDAKTDAQRAAEAAQEAQGTADEASKAAEAATGTASNATTAAQEAAAAAVKAQEDAASAAGIADGKADVLIQAAAPADEYRKASTLWIDTTSNANTPKRWNGSAWAAVTDKKAADAATAASNAAKAATEAQGAAQAAQVAADAAAAVATAAKSRADEAHNLAGTAESNAQSALSSAAGAASAAQEAQGTADKAKEDAAAAAGLADGKADVLIQAATPGTEYHKSTTLWIDTTSSANTPKRWNGSAWATVTDKKATDAATAASNAQKAADAAKAAADTVSKNLFSTEAPSGTAPYGSTWFQVNSSGQVIGQWQQTADGIASTWTARAIRSEVIANLDVGKLTAGSVTTPTAVVDKLYGDVVESRQLKGDYIEADSISARHMQLVGDNLIPDPYFLDEDRNAKRISGSTTIPDGVKTFVADDLSTANIFRFSEHADDYRSFLVGGTTDDGRVPAKKGDVFKFRVLYRARGNAVEGAATSGIRMAVYQDSPTKSYIRYTGVGSYKTITTAGPTWYEWTGEYKITQDDVGYIRPMVQFRNPAWSGDLEIKVPSMLNAATAGTLEAELVLASKIIAGDRTGTHAEMSPEGFRVYAADPSDGVAKEVVRMGVADTDDYFAVTRSDGSLAATISQDGNIASNSISVDKDIYYRGDTLEAILERLPRGIIAQAYRTTASPTYDATTKPYLHITFPVESGRMYKISTNNWKVTGTSSALGSMWWSDTGRATLSSAWLDYCYTAPTNMGGSWQTPIHFNRTFRSWWTGTLSILVAIRAIGASGTITLQGDGGSNANVLLIEDLGIMPQDTGEWQDGTQATPPPVKRTYETTWTASATRSYLPGGGVYNFNTTKMFQGLSPAGYGNLSSAAVFPDMTATLSGATINSIQVYLYFDHWYYNNGGTARIGLIGKSLPGTMTASTGIVATSGGWPKPGGRWVSIPSTYFDKFKTGGWGGITLNGDGSYGTYGYANNQPKIKINYTK